MSRQSSSNLNSMPLRRCRFTIICLLALLLASCQTITPSSVTVIIEPAASTKASISSTPTKQPAAQEPAPRTPPALPRPYQSPFLNVYDTPHGYIKDDCQYLKARWDPNNAAPGTVVMIIMFRGIYKGVVESYDGVNVVTFHKIMKELKDQGFEAINTLQLLGFLTTNEKIPPRSVVIIQDGRHQGDHYEDHFREYWESWKWPIVNGWPSQSDTTEKMWQENIALETEGWVDHQAQGVMIGTYLSDNSPSAVISRELKGSVTAFEERFNKKPIAIVWPGGGFGFDPVEAARQLGYKLGFTLNSRGPVMYNWVPLANKADAGRPAYPPEGVINDPLMTLPRYWPYQVLEALDKVRVIGKEAGAYAEENKSIEMEYYDIVCAPTYGPVPTTIP